MIENKNLNEFMVPTNDYIFKRIFGYVGNEHITKDLLESILKIKLNSISLDGNTILEKDLASDKIGILDVKAIVILIADFDFKKIENLKNINNYHTKWQIASDDSGKHILTDVLEIHMISLKLVEKLFKKSYNKDDENLIRWLKFIKKPELLEERDMENVNIREAKEQLDELKKSEYEQELAEYRMKELRDKKAIESYGFNSGIKKGKIEIAKKMLEKGISIEEIIEITELTEDEIKKLK